MLDITRKKHAEFCERFGYEFWQLRTPQPFCHSLIGAPYGIDNGCFNVTGFDEKKWMKVVQQAEQHPAKFITVPDMVGDAVRTMDLFEHFKRQLNGHPRALVIQDGIGRLQIPWADLSAVFVGGTDHFKYSTEAMNVCKVAKLLGKWIHVGRVNTTRRAMYWKDIADSCDGSGMSRYDDRIQDVLYALRNESPQTSLM